MHLMHLNAKLGAQRAVQPAKAKALRSGGHRGMCVQLVWQCQGVRRIRDSVLLGTCLVVLSQTLHHPKLSALQPKPLT